MWDATPRRQNCACAIIEAVAWGPRRQLLGRFCCRSKAMRPPQLGPMAAQAHYSLAFVNSSHMRREKWTSNLHWLRYSRVWRITLISVRASLISSPGPYTVSPVTSMCPVSVQGGVFHKQTPASEDCRLVYTTQAVLFAGFDWFLYLGISWWVSLLNLSICEDFHVSIYETWD